MSDYQRAVAVTTRYTPNRSRSTIGGTQRSGRPLLVKRKQQLVSPSFKAAFYQAFKSSGKLIRVFPSMCPAPSELNHHVLTSVKSLIADVGSGRSTMSQRDSNRHDDDIHPWLHGENIAIPARTAINMCRNPTRFHSVIADSNLDSCIFGHTLKLLLAHTLYYVFYLDPRFFSERSSVLPRLASQ